MKSTSELRCRHLDPEHVRRNSCRCGVHCDLNLFSSMCAFVSMSETRRKSENSHFPTVFCTVALMLKLTLSQHVCICVHVRGLSDFRKRSFSNVFVQICIEASIHVESARVHLCNFQSLPPNRKNIHISIVFCKFTR